MAELKELRAEVGELRQLVVAAVGDRTIDPAAGSGGFLIEAVRRLLEQSNAAGASELPADVEEAATEVGRAVETTIAERRPSAPGRARPKGTGR
jgi:23S rRNA G2445 N2-methylase RlmL